MADPLETWVQSCVRPILNRREQFTDKQFENLIVQTIMGFYDAGKSNGIKTERKRMLEIMIDMDNRE